ncbi:MAG TPA: hypothetical protein VNA44_10150, partial [Burkholderiaceae bacterium]|nr:hypothetical protein [Burkholderiaceae bacterium]
MNRQTLFQEVVHVLQNELSHPPQAWQLGIIVLALLAGWFYARQIERRARETLTAAATAPHGVRVDVLKFSIDGFRRLAFPIAAMVLLVLGGLALYLSGVVLSGEVHLLQLTLLLLGAMAAIRLFVYVLRRSLQRAAWIGTFELAIAFTIWVVVALYVTGLLDDLVNYFDAVRFPVGKPPLTLWDILAGVV